LFLCRLIDSFISASVALHTALYKSEYSSSYYYYFTTEQPDSALSPTPITHARSNASRATASTYMWALNKISLDGKQMKSQNLTFCILLKYVDDCQQSFGLLEC